MLKPRHFAEHAAAAAAITRVIAATYRWTTNCPLFSDMPQSNVFHRRRFLSGAAIGVAAGIAGSARTTSPTSTQRLPVEGRLPSLKHATDWLNSKPLDIASLRGKVVAINFCTYTCINWLRTVPYVRAWSKQYKDNGLVVVGVHTPEFTFEHNIGNIRTAMDERKIDYPIAIDNDYAIWRAFGNEYWPALYFVDAKGRIRHHKFGEGEYEQAEAVIQSLLREAGSNVDSGFVSADAQAIEAAAGWSELQSPENYLGKARTEHFASLRDGRCYAIPSRLKLNDWALSGDWMVGKEAIVLNEAHGRIAYHFHARDLHLVMAPAAAGHAVRFRVSIDGQPPWSNHGIDVDENGYGMLAGPRLHQLIRQSQPITDRQFEIEFLDRGAEAFSFTFG